MPTSISDLLEALDAYPVHVPVKELARRLSALEVGLDELEHVVRFDDGHYRRNLLHAGRCYHVLILCWKSGQRSPIHNHYGSSCAVRVLKGTATETVFELNDQGLVYPTLTRRLGEGQVCASFDLDIHQMSNLAPEGEALITLHIYSPPLIEMSMYSLTEPGIRKFTDPIYGLCEGAGI